MNPPEATLKAQAETTEPPLKKFRRLAQDTAARATISSTAPLAPVDNELALYRVVQKSGSPVLILR